MVILGPYCCNLKLWFPLTTVSTDVLFFCEDFKYFFRKWEYRCKHSSICHFLQKNMEKKKKKKKRILYKYCGSRNARNHNLGSFKLLIISTTGNGIKCHVWITVLQCCQKILLSHFCPWTSNGPKFSWLVTYHFPVSLWILNKNTSPRRY